MPRLLNQIGSLLAPAPRKPGAWKGIWLPLTFLAVIGLALVILDLSGRFRVSRPWVLAGLVPTSLWFWWINAANTGAGLGKGRAITAVILRLCLVATAFILLAEPRAIRRSNAQTILYALDISDSMGGGASDKSIRYMLNSSGGKRENDEIGLIVFGRDAAVELPPRTSFPFEAINSRIMRDGTDLDEALSLSASILPEDKPGRVIFISDGRSTEGEVSAAVERFRQRGIPVDVLPVTYAFAKEVWLERLEVPLDVKKGETYEASVILSSLKPGKGNLVLYENGKEIGRQTVDYKEGKNRFAFPLYMRGPGFYEYMASLEPEPGEDGWEENNLAMNDVYLEGEGRVLVVKQAGADDRDTVLLVQALKQSDRLVETIDAFELAREARNLQGYDCIIFANVPADAFDPRQLKAIRDAVYDQGSGFLMVGGENSFGPGGYHRSDIETILPVNMDIQEKKVLPKGALAIVLHTCEFAEGNTWAKRIAKEAIRVLSDQDEVGVLDFEYNANGTRQPDDWIFPLTPASKYEELAVKINQSTPEDMPSFEPTMSLALQGLKKSDASLKHLIVISDGDPTPPTPKTIQGFIDNKISITTIAINPHGGNDISNMQQVAEATGGRYYFPQSPEELPAIFIKEAKTLKRSMIQNTEFNPIVEFPSPVLKGIESLASLRGYVLTSPKERAELILRAPAESKEFPDEINPVLALWRHGAGRTAAFTSDLSANWGANWAKTPMFQPFVKQLIEEISRVKLPTDLSLQAFANGNEGVFTLNDQAVGQKGLLDFQAKVAGPGGREESVRLEQTAPGRYRARFPLWGRGNYRIVVVGKNDQRTDSAIGGLSLPYSPEYLNFSSDPAALEWIAERTGGRVLTGTEAEAATLLDLNPPIREGSRPALEWFFIALAILLPLDVAARRVQLDWRAIANRLMGRNTDATATMAELLKRKRETGPAAKPIALPTKTKSSAPPPATPSRPPSQAPAAVVNRPKAAEGDDEAGLSTAERLLRRKKSRDNDNPPN